MRTRGLIAAGCALAALMAGGCHQQPPPAEEPEAEQPAEQPAPASPPAPKPAAPAPKPAPPPAPAPVPRDQQMIDDAEATGMTARLPAPAENGAAQPADEAVRQQ